MPFLSRYKPYELFTNSLYLLYFLNVLMSLLVSRAEFYCLYCLNKTVVCQWCENRDENEDEQWFLLSHNQAPHGYTYRVRRWW